jgi:hypothetical protein
MPNFPNLIFTLITSFAYLASATRTTYPHFVQGILVSIIPAEKFQKLDLTFAYLTGKDRVLPLGYSAVASIAVRDKPAGLTATGRPATHLRLVGEPATFSAILILEIRHSFVPTVSWHH